MTQVEPIPADPNYPGTRADLVRAPGAAGPRSGLADLGRDPRAGAPGAIEAIREFWPGDHVQMRARAFYSGRVLVQVFHEQSAEKTI